MAGVMTRSSNIEVIPPRLYDCLEMTIKETDSVHEEYDGKNPSYLAVSHVWGETATLVIPGVPWNVPICQGKFETIISYCARQGIRWMWIDCICMRHDDDSDAQHEKGLEVGKMSHYYKNACDFLCFPHGDWEEFAEAVGRQTELRDIVGLFEFPPTCAERLWDNIYYLDKILANQWLHRTWTYQELLLAKDIHLPDGTGFDVDLIGRVVLWYYTILRKGILNKPDHSRDYEYIHTDKEMVISKGWWVPVASWNTKSKFIETGTLDLMTAVNTTRNKQCTYPVDRLYGLYGVIKEEDKVEVEYCNELSDEERRSSALLSKKWKETMISIVSSGRVWPLLMDGIEIYDWFPGEIWIPRITAPELSYGDVHPEVIDSLNLLGITASNAGLEISVRRVGIVTGSSESFGDGGGEINRMIACVWILAAQRFDIGPVKAQMDLGLERSDIEKGEDPEASKRALSEALGSDTLEACFKVVEKEQLRKKLLYGIGGWNRHVVCLRVEEHSQPLVFLAWIHSTKRPKRSRCWVMDVTSEGTAAYWIIVNEEDDGTYTKIGTVKSWSINSSMGLTKVKLN